jgi:hypothetical protein
MVTPTGGPKDTKEPQVKKSNPPNGATNFKGTKIDISFNEYVVLKDLQNQLIVSPGNQEPEITKHKKTIEIKFKDSLQSNTTYILNFGNSIVDFAENNPVKDYKFIFCTSENIDTLQLSGKVIDAYSTEGLKDILVSLYPAEKERDSTFLLDKPNYTVRTKEGGRYLFTNIKKGKYFLRAIKESNNNKIFDSRDELIAFQSEVLHLDSNTQAAELRMFQEIPPQIKVVEKDNSYLKTELVLNKKFQNYSIKDKLNNIDTIVSNHERDSLKIYYKALTDTNTLYLQQSTKIDTIKLKFSKTLKKQTLTLNVSSKYYNDT